MKRLSLIFVAGLAAAGLSMAQSNPSWWKYTPPESTAIVGMQWKALQMSPFASVIAAEMAPGGSFGFPDIELLRRADQVLIGSPSMVAVEYGLFPIEKLRSQAAAAGLKRHQFNRAELYVPSNPAVKCVAYINERLVLVGALADLQEAIDRVANPKERSYSPLLGRAARYSKEDLWVVAERLPDPLASHFVPVDVEASAFEGSVSLWDGLHMVAAIERSTPTRALDLADSLAESLAARPAMAEATEITTKDRSVLIRMDLDEAALASSLRVPHYSEPAPLAEPHGLVAIADVEPAKPQPRSFVPPTSTTDAPASPTAISAAVPEVVVPDALGPAAIRPTLPPPPPKKIRIMGLESGPREIPLGQ